MAGANNIPERLTGFRVYNGKNDLLGISDIELPALESMTETVTGAGIAGEIDSPTLGHYGSMTATFNWRTITDKMLELAAQKSHALDARGSIQVYDSANGEYKTIAVRLSMKGTPKNTEFGSFETGATMDASQEFEVSYLKLFFDGKEKVEIDKYNYIAKFNGNDLLASVRKDLGLK